MSNYFPHISIYKKYGILWIHYNGNSGKSGQFRKTPGIPEIPDNRKIGKLEIPYNLFFSKIRDPGCRGSIRLVKTVCLNQFSDFIIIKKGPKSIFLWFFFEKSSRSSLNKICVFSSFWAFEGGKWCKMIRGILFPPGDGPPAPQKVPKIAKFRQNCIVFETVGKNYLKS